MTNHSMKWTFFSPGVDVLLAQHVAHILMRDPLMATAETFETDHGGNEHFDVSYVKSARRMGVKSSRIL